MGSQFAARSPAIDAGSDDAYGYDSTSTHLKVIDLGQPDIGYHYYRRVADDDPVDEQDIRITFRVPTTNGVDIDKFQADYSGNEGLPEDITYTVGQDVIEHQLFAETDPIPIGPHILRVKTINSGGEESEPAEINLIVDPDAPVVTVSQ